MLTDLKETIPPTVPLGQKSPYPSHYDQSLLFPIERAKQRAAMGLGHAAVSEGFDVWNAYELYWLDQKGKPVRGYATFIVPATSPHLLESKSVKLYLHSLNHQRFSSALEVRNILVNDFSLLCASQVQVIMYPAHLATLHNDISSTHRCLDDIDMKIEHYERAPQLLTKDSAGHVEEKLVSHLFKSHCLCTGQPDMGSIFIEYTGPKIDDRGLLGYLVSYRDHVGFTENCIEQIFFDIHERIEPEKLLVFGCFSRRGGIQIDPYRATHPIPFQNKRLIFQ